MQSDIAPMSLFAQAATRHNISTPHMRIVMIIICDIMRNYRQAPTGTRPGVRSGDHKKDWETWIY